eukprot:1161219-Pleurochrysis_carterae.AAC.3
MLQTGITIHANDNVKQGVAAMSLYNVQATFWLRESKDAIAKPRQRPSSILNAVRVLAWLHFDIWH